MSNDLQRLQTNIRMSQVVFADRVVYLAGQVPDSTYASITQQATEILLSIDTLLAIAGIDKKSLLSANIRLSDARYFDEFNCVWDAWLPEGHAPTQACVQSLLMKAGLDVEIAVTALAS
ncbi:RidA family protein [Bradyrhizobium sp. CCBAU 21360]|uniref:RidA family protein n=1 Tax=Bradyrhizobium sp. CCBAU 21360 TaxID=1325081 RepID=UPI002304EDCE|nr:RidA family protein [Bradyrhizobium sp. CCBAU 21360]MDA9445859.1 endoribonuclease [Bradyrhizobium sp. CCBAU 21360]